VAAEFVHQVEAHLDFEETRTFPVYEAYVTAADHLGLDARVSAQTTVDELGFVVPRVFDRLPLGIRNQTMLVLPALMKVMYYGHVEAYRRLAASIRP
jgi:hypothetical protein